MTTTDDEVFWELIDELRAEDPRIEEGTIMGGRCARVAGEFLALVDFKDSGMVVKLPRARVDELIAQRIGRPFAPPARYSASGCPSSNAIADDGARFSAKESPSSPHDPSTSDRATAGTDVDLMPDLNVQATARRSR